MHAPHIESESSPPSSQLEEHPDVVPTVVEVYNHHHKTRAKLVPTVYIIHFSHTRIYLQLLQKEIMSW